MDKRQHHSSFKAYIVHYQVHRIVS